MRLRLILIVLKFRRIGHIFNPALYSWDKNFVGYAQSPQALVFPNHVRVYFSTRLQDGPTAYVSHVRYVDFSKDFTRVIGWSQHEVLGPGDTGCFDEHGVFPLNVLRVGAEIFGYTNGWTRRVSVPVDTGIGLVVSHDGGESFVRQGKGPVLAASLHEPFLVGDAFVRHSEDRFQMWYIFGTHWLEPTDGGSAERVYKIGMADSADGIQWQKSGRRLIEDRLGHHECQALPTVLRIGGRFHMIFCYRDAVDFRRNPLNAYRLGYAWSADGESWTRTDDLRGLTPPLDAWDTEMMCYPHFCVVDDRVYLLYNGNAFGREGFGVAELC